MSYENPEKWDDVDSAGNQLVWATRKDKLLYPAYEMLRLSLVEKCEVTSTSIPVRLQSPLRPENKHIPFAWKQDFQNTMTILIPKFVNHTDNAGEWNGLKNAAPWWIEADMLSHLSDTERLNIGHLNSANWEIQNYKLLNLMRRTKNILNSTDSTNSMAYLVYGPTKTWEEAKQDAIYDNPLSFFNRTSSDYFSFFSSYQVINIDSFNYKYFWHMLQTTNFKLFLGTIPGVDYIADVDYYAYSSGWANTGEGRYDAEAAGVPYRTWKKLGSNSINFSTIGTNPWLEMNFDLDIPYPVPENDPGPYYEFAKGYQYAKTEGSGPESGPPYAVINYAVETGFKFQDNTI